MKAGRTKRKKTYTIMLFGQTYTFPVTPETAPIIALLRGETKPWAVTKIRSQWERQSLVERGMREIIATLLHQVRDTAGAAVTQQILQEISDKLSPLVQGRVDADMRKALPMPDKALGDGKSQKP